MEDGAVDAVDALRPCINREAESENTELAELADEGVGLAGRLDTTSAGAETGSSSMSSGTGPAGVRGLNAVGGASQRGVKRKPRSLASQSAVNVNDVCGVGPAERPGVASGSGDAGRTRVMPLTSPLRRIFLMFRGATGTACG